MPLTPAKVPSSLLSSDKGISLSASFCKERKNPMICIVGPTASGKTDFSLDIAEKINGEIINVDSRQFYRGLDIGTAKIRPEEMRNIPHYGLSFLSPDENFSVGQFFPFAEKIIEDIFSRKKIPILVGGSGLFVDALRKNFAIPPVAPDPIFREKMEKKSDTELFELLWENDPESAEKIGKKRRRNIIRALEVFFTTGKKFSDLKKTKTRKYDDLVLALWVDPEILRQRISYRVDMMFSFGFLDEVKKLLEQGFSEMSPAMNAHGYREAVAFLRGEISEETMRLQMIRATQQYAKRQRTWWRAQEEVVWIEGISSQMKG